jgi:hypothetical protein
MATGEKKWSSGGQEVKRTSFAPIPTGDYELRVKRVWEVRKSDSPKSSQLRYANGYFEVIIPGKDKPRRQYHSFHVDLTPSVKDSIAMPNRGGQIVEFCKAVGEELNANIIQQEKNKDGVKTRVDTLSPKAIVEFMNNLDGTTLHAHIKVEKNWKGEDDNVIEYFVESEPSEGDSEASDEESDEEAPLDEETEEAEETEETEADEEAEESDEDEESDEPEELETAELEDLPPPRDTSKGKVVQGPPGKKAAKPAPKAAAKPAGKPAKKK